MEIKRIFFVLMVSFLVFQSCEKKEKDPRDKYVGTWSGLYTVKVDALSVNESDSVTVIIEKDTANINQILIDDQVAIVNGDTYTYKEVTEAEIDPILGPLIVTLNGSGILSGTSITETGTIIIKTAGLNLTGNWSQTLKKK
jgi:hypothetical protein